MYQCRANTPVYTCQKCDRLPTSLGILVYSLLPGMQYVLCAIYFQQNLLCLLHI